MIWEENLLLALSNAKKAAQKLALMPFVEPAAK
jgi:hypothetical protein